MRVAFVVVLSLLLAGCVEESPVEEATVDSVPEVPGDEVTVVWLEGGVTGVGACPEGGPHFIAGNLSPAGVFGVRDDAVALILEARFEGVHGRVCLGIRDGAGNLHQVMPGPTQVLVDALTFSMANPPAGEWGVVAYFDGPVSATHEMAVSTFTVAPVPGYTAW